MMSGMGDMMGAAWAAGGLFVAGLGGLVLVVLVLAAVALTKYIFTKRPPEQRPPEQRHG
ncbi:MAG: hypothetical protein ACT4P2_10325 [Pseudomonadota bacterium]